MQYSEVIKYTDLKLLTKAMHSENTSQVIIDIHVIFKASILHVLLKYYMSTTGQSIYYPNRLSVSKNFENRATLADCQSTTATILADFLLAEYFFVEAPKLKVSLTDPLIIKSFVIGEEWSTLGHQKGLHCRHHLIFQRV